MNCREHPKWGLSLRHLVNKKNNLLIIYPFYLHSYLQLITASVRPLHPEDVKKLRPQQIPLSQSHKKARSRRKWRFGGTQIGTPHRSRYYLHFDFSKNLDVRRSLSSSSWLHSSTMLHKVKWLRPASHTTHTGQPSERQPGDHRCWNIIITQDQTCLLYTSPSPRD